MFAVAISFLTAFALAGVAAWFSITGLIAIFAALPVPVAIMAGVLEVAKLVTASILYRNWKTIPFLIKTYLMVAVVVLMFITSLGIFGYLSRAHIEQAAPVSANVAKIERLEQRIEREQRIITDAETVTTQLDNTIATLIKFDKISGPEGARAVREKQQPQRDELSATINQSQSKIDEYLDQKVELEQSVRNFETEIGPIKYITALVYDDPQSHYEESVRYIILLLVFVFDPLAVILLITANHIQVVTKPKPTSEVSVVDAIDPSSWEDDDEDDVRDLSRLRELMSVIPPWETVQKVETPVTSDTITKPEEPFVMTVAEEDPQTTVEYLNSLSTKDLDRIVHALDQQQATRRLTPSEEAWRSKVTTIVRKRERENPILLIRDAPRNVDI